MATKGLKDYLHYYLGCKCKVQEFEELFTLTGVSYDDTERGWWAYFENTEVGYAPYTKTKPILRPLSDMTEDEYDELEKINEDETVIEVRNSKFELDFRPVIAQTTKRMFEMGFDLFGLIESGLAIDKTKITAHGN